MVGDYISREAVLTVLDWDCASQDALNAIKAIPPPMLWRWSDAMSANTGSIVLIGSMTSVPISLRQSALAIQRISAPVVSVRERRTMYNDLVERLRYCAVSDNQCLECKYRGGSPDGSKMCLDLLMVEAADAIEELNKQIKNWEEALKNALDFIHTLDAAPGAAEGGSVIKRIIHKLKHKRFCKLNNYFCPDCIYHDFVWEGITFRGNRCHYPKEETK